jgi:hypothetical protein
MHAALKRADSICFCDIALYRLVIVQVVSWDFVQQGDRTTVARYVPRLHHKGVSSAYADEGQDAPCFTC